MRGNSESNGSMSTSRVKGSLRRASPPSALSPHLTRRSLSSRNSSADRSRASITSTSHDRKYHRPTRGRTANATVARTTTISWRLEQKSRMTSFSSTPAPSHSSHAPRSASTKMCGSRIPPALRPSSPILYIT